MKTANYRTSSDSSHPSADDDAVVTLTVPDTHELPHMLQIHRKNQHDMGTKVQYFYREDTR